MMRCPVLQKTMNSHRLAREVEEPRRHLPTRARDDRVSFVAGPDAIARSQSAAGSHSLRWTGASAPSPQCLRGSQRTPGHFPR